MQGSDGSAHSGAGAGRASPAPERAARELQGVRGWSANRPGDRRGPHSRCAGVSAARCRRTIRSRAAAPQATEGLVRSSSRLWRSGRRPGSRAPASRRSTAERARQSRRRIGCDVMALPDRTGQGSEGSGCRPAAFRTKSRPWSRCDAAWCLRACASICGSADRASRAGRVAAGHPGGASQPRRSRRRAMASATRASPSSFSAVRRLWAEHICTIPSTVDGPPRANGSTW